MKLWIVVCIIVRWIYVFEMYEYGVFILNNIWNVGCWCEVLCWVVYCYDVGDLVEDFIGSLWVEECFVGRIEFWCREFIVWLLEVIFVGCNFLFFIGLLVVILLGFIFNCVVVVGLLLIYLIGILFVERERVRVRLREGE